MALVGKVTALQNIGLTMAIVCGLPVCERDRSSLGSVSQQRLNNRYKDICQSNLYTGNALNYFQEHIVQQI